ncbi:FliM/FliN family flagellar motor switch protein [Mangrovicella endophytica]|uniref:FliM/FliN family flagellar motor switch protein n=1 Tax=Mangrovicella endophytica TaxID=2066697 RepID=UPI000C9E83B2|nr:FliM/FliN family flagellar motor switch protein [Mangrovicella endophytica]
MSALAKDVIASQGVGARIRSAAEIEPSRLPLLRVIAQSWTDAVRAGMETLAISPVTIELAGISSTDFNKTSAMVTDAALGAVAASPKWGENGFILGDTNLVDLVLETFFGGDGSPREASDRSVTELDKSFVELALKTFNKAANRAFADIEEMGLTTRDTASHEIGEAIGASLQGSRSRYVCITFELRTGSIKAELRYALPESFVASHRRKLSVMPETSTAVLDEGWQRQIHSGLGHAEMKLTAILGEKTMTLDEVSHLAVGQTLVLSETIESLIRIECEDQGLFRGKVGRSREAFVVSIEDKIDPTEEFIDDILSD